MRTLLIVLLFAVPFLGSTQQFKVEKNKDTLRSPGIDTIFSIPFSLKGLMLNSKPKVSIIFDSGTGILGRDFNLLDAYNSEGNQIEISKVEKMSGVFKIQISGDISEPKTINLKILIFDGKQSIKDIIKITLLPALKSEPQSAQTKPDKKESIEFFITTENRIRVYKMNAGIENFVREVDLSGSPEIIQKSKQAYRIKIVTTENDIYLSNIKLSTDFEFPVDDKLFFRGNSNDVFMHASDLFLINHIVESEKIQKAQDGVIKFKL